MKYYRKKFKRRTRPYKSSLSRAMPYGSKPIVCDQLFSIVPNANNQFALNIGSLLPIVRLFRGLVQQLPL